MFTEFVYAFWWFLSVAYWLCVGCLLVFTRPYVLLISLVVDWCRLICFAYCSNGFGWTIFFVWRLSLLCSSIDFWWFPIDFWWWLFPLLLVAYWLLLVSCWFQSLLNWCSASFLLGFKRCLVAAFHSFGLTLHVRISLRFFRFVRNLRFSRFN